MDSGYENVQDEPRDRTKWIWLGVAVVVVAMIVALALTQQPPTTVSLVHAQHILISANMGDPADRQRALEQAKEIRERILKGESFSDLAREYSNDAYSSKRGGDLGYAQRGTYEEAFEKYVWTAPIGEVGPPLRSGRGFHIVKVLDRRLSRADKYEQELAERARKKLGEQQRATQGASTSTAPAPSAPAPATPATPTTPAP